MIASAFKGIKIAVGLLILDAGMNMMKKMKRSALSTGIMISAFAAMLSTPKKPSRNMEII